METNLFAAEATPEKPISLVAEYLIETEGLHPDWRWHSMKVLDHKGQEPKDWNFTQYEGGVYPTPLSRGPRKGRPNFKKPLPGSERVCVVNQKAFIAWLPTWEARTGKCHECRGTGACWAGWNHKTGDRFRPCDRCGETGNAPTPPSTPA